MPTRRTQTISLLTALLMAWAAVWCCCVPAKAATHKRACCVETETAHSSCPAPSKSPADCPLIQARQNNTIPLPAVQPPANDLLCILPIWLAPLPAVVTAPAFARPTEAADPPSDPPTLLGLHTSLLW